MPESTKTALIIQLLAADIPYQQIMAQCQCSMQLVYKVRSRHADEIAAIKAGEPPARSKVARPPSLAVPSRVSPKKAGPELEMPRIDPAKPVAPQLEGLAWQILAAAAVDAGITGRQVDSAKEILKQSQRDKQPPPTDRHMRFLISEIDVDESDPSRFRTVGSTSYDIKI